MSESKYTTEFYNIQKGGSYASACEIVPLLLNLVKPSSVLDVGCGVGTWLKVFKEHGINDIMGVDGDYVDRNCLVIDEKEFLPADLNKAINLNRQFDLAISMEVGEHLNPEKSNNLVRTLTSHAPVVLFSAAVPFQEGTFHINEQWPEFWRDLFHKHNFEVVDCVRDAVWNNPNVEYFYAQNALLYVQQRKLEQFQKLKAHYVNQTNKPLARIHPAKWMEAHDPRASGMRKLMKQFPHALKNSIVGTIRRLTRS